MNLKRNIAKLYQWEYWPSYMFYLPNIPFALFHAIKAKNLVFYTAVNPSISNSGIGTESKFETLKLIPDAYIPSSVFHKKGSNTNHTLHELKIKGIEYPLIAKPDIGFRGLLVQKIDSESALLTYIQKYPIDIILQEFLKEPHECGIFFQRHPQETKGVITSITLKEFLHVTGNGNSTVLELIQKHSRAKIYLKLISENPRINLNQILGQGIKLQLSDIGNHSKGTQFINGNHLISPQLEKAFNLLNQQIKGWYYGRLDIKYNSLEDLEKGLFKIIELNGILAEPTHIYDASKITYLKALKEMRTHWKNLYRIARYNHDTKQVPYKSVIGLIKEVRNLKRYTKNLQKLSRIA